MGEDGHRGNRNGNHGGNPINETRVLGIEIIFNKWKIHQRKSGMKSNEIPENQLLQECDAHTYLYSLSMGHTQLLEQTVLALIGRMLRLWWSVSMMENKRNGDVSYHTCT